jgi:hypothetical protein
MVCVVLPSASQNNVLRGVGLDSYIKCKIEAILDKKGHLIQSGMHYMKEMFASTGNSLSLAVSLLDDASSVKWTAGIFKPQNKIPSHPLTKHFYL